MFLLSLLIAPSLAAAAPAAPTAPVAPSTVTTASGLRFQTLRPGTGPRPAPEDAVLVTYEGRLADGTVFDSAAEPVGFAVAEVVPGFAEALLLMNKGGTYRVWIPPQLAYGERGGGGIPPNAELDFTVTLVGIGRAVRETRAEPQAD